MRLLVFPLFFILGIGLGVLLFPHASLDCGIVSSVKVNGTSMQPLMLDGSEILIRWGAYECSDIKRGDIVAFRFAVRQDTLIKRIVAIPGDVISVDHQKLLVNGKSVANSLHQLYLFSPQQISQLTRGLKNQKLDIDHYLLLADNLQNNYDSRYFGPVFKSQVVGKYVR